jgi:flagellar motility protein MotE (MotC chaperone)
MRRVPRAVVAAGIAAKLALAGAWWWTSVARAEKTGAGAPGVSADLFEKSRGFRELLAAVEQRGQELDRREQVVAEREAALKALEATLGDQVAKLEPAPAAGAAPGGPHDAAAAAAATAGPCGVVVTKVYQSMKPEEAAPIIDRMDDATATSIFACMKERQIGAILALMNKDRAVALTKALANAS